MDKGFEKNIASGNMVEFLIKENFFEIKFKNKVTKLNREEIIDLYCSTKALLKLEKSRGNELDKGFIELVVKENLVIKQYINIFGLVRLGTYVEFVEYFINLKDKYNRPGGNTKPELNNYLEERGNISQKIILKLIFTIKTNEKEVKKRANLIKKTDRRNFVEIYNELKEKTKI